MKIGDVWTLAEIRNNKLRDVSYELLTWGRKLASSLGTDLCSVVLIDNIQQRQLDCLIEHGADKVYLVKDPMLRGFLVEPHAHVLQHLVNTYEPWVFLGAATTTGRTVMPYLSMMIHTGLTADCTDLKIELETNNLLQIRPAIGGNIMATIITPNSRPQMATVRPRSINVLEPDKNRSGQVIEIEAPQECLKSRMVIESFDNESQNLTSLEEAEVVVSGGRGVRESGNFELIEQFANILGGAVASSRPPVDLNWQPYAHQVGLSGKTISPDLYIACGISGAVQHLAGIQTAKNIVAIDNNPEAPIFQVADFGIVGDMFDVLPALIRRIENNRSENIEQ